MLKTFVRSFVRRCGYDIKACLPEPMEKTPSLRTEFRQLKFAGLAAQKLLDEYDFESVLDIGCGDGEHSEIFMRHRKKVTALDYGKSIYFQENQHRFECLVGDFNTMRFAQQFDCVWASHVLEHQLNVGIFLRRIFEVLKEGGLVCITVPPYGPEILGGHVSVWNAGLLLYNLVLAGFDCHAASILRYGYNISVIARKTTVKLPELAFDNGDVTRIAQFLPDGLREGFSGNIERLNW